MKIGLVNGLLLGTLAIVVITAYIVIFKGKEFSIFNFDWTMCSVSFIEVTLVLSSLMGTMVPITFHSINIDPAVASGPLITTLNDLTAVIVYYGLSWLLIIKVFEWYKKLDFLLIFYFIHFNL